MTYCCKCNSSITNLVYAKFIKTTGIIIARKNYYFNGYVCYSCLNKLYRECVVHDLLLGWWSITGIIHVPVDIILNTITYIKGKNVLKKEKNEEVFN